ncbi:hypothetical protein N826_19595 [Skermanella aerolata KACC 11604]|nr:hypothetical protein N826_19595 [Skermanella aerolata KACC 11604]
MWEAMESKVFAPDKVALPKVVLGQDCIFKPSAAGRQQHHLLRFPMLPSLFRLTRFGQQLMDAAALGQVGADKPGEGEWALDGVLRGLGEPQQHEGDQRPGDLDPYGVLASVMAEMADSR